MPRAARYTGRMQLTRRIKHCRECGTPVDYRIPEDDNRERATCPACRTIHYENPLNVVGTVPFWEDQVLLRRQLLQQEEVLDTFSEVGTAFCMRFWPLL